MPTEIWLPDAPPPTTDLGLGGPTGRFGPPVGRALIDRERSVLSQFARLSRPWSRQRVLVPVRVRRVLWFALPVQLVWATWLAALMSGVVSCGRPVCTVATLDGRVGFLFVCAMISIILLTGLAVTTRGLSTTDCREAASLTCAVASGSLALLGVAAVLSLVAVVVITFAVFFATMTVSP